MRTTTITSALSVCALCAPALAQTGEYFITTEDQPTDDIRVVQNGAIQRSWLPPIRQGAIAVSNSVHTIDEAFGSSGIFAGGHWTKGGTPLGPASLDTTGIVTGRIIDGTFDGRSSTYVVSGFDAFGTPVTGGEVWRFGPGFSGPGALMFAVGQNDQGITYDLQTNTIWTSEYNLNGNLGLIKQWDLAGNLIFSFPAQYVAPTGALIQSERNTALAYDPLDDTFWFNAHVENTLTGTEGELWQFDRNGNFLQAIDPDPNRDVKYWGGEFMIPTPAGAALLAGAGLLGLRRRRD